MPDLNELTLMFLTLILQYLNKLIEGKVGDLTSPKSFHARKVQGFNNDCIKLLTEFRGELSMKVFALVRDFPIQACELSYRPPPTVRTLNLSRKTFVERLKCVQGLFQRLSVVFLLTRAQRQICVFHTEVCPDTLTRRWQRFSFYKIGDHIQPIVTAVIALDCDTADSPIKLTVLMKRIWHFIISPLAIFPLPESECDTIVF